MSTEDYLDSFGLSVDLCYQFVIDNLDRPDNILFFAQKFGIDNQMIAEIVGAYIDGISEGLVVDYFSQHGYDSLAILDNEGVQISRYESESNNSVLSANTITLNENFQGSLSIANDVDWFHFNLSGPANVEIVYNGRIYDNWYPDDYTGGLNYYWVDAIGLILDESLNSITSFDLDFDATIYGASREWESTGFYSSQGGDYYLVVGFEEYDGLSSDENYDISVNVDYIF